MATPGIITEQGFAVGEGLGFNPLSEQDQDKIKSNNKESDLGSDKENGR